MAVKYLIVDAEREGQRLDNFLFTQFKQVPKSRVYRALRKGEVRVNRHRVQADYRLVAGDDIRIPPLQQDETIVPQFIPSDRTIQLLNNRILYEDAGFIALNKPSGIAVHGGSGINYGIIEAMRVLRPELKDLELVHRLDRDTSGCLLIAKKHSILRKLHELIREHHITKIYQCLCRGRWRGDMQRINAPLLKNEVHGGERIVTISPQGKPSLTTFRVIERFAQASLMQAELATGRTHQIRVHAASVKHELAGDERYGNREFNQIMKQQYGLQRIFLHAQSLKFISPVSGEELLIEAPLDDDLAKVLENLQLK